MSNEELVQKLEYLEDRCEEVIVKCDELSDECRYLLYDISDFLIDCEEGGSLDD